ncbi:MAG: bifunctional hexulose-6-phosphate synthase/ribonuclease regulator, partial [Thermoplasmata archaeon]|nr:bifunctional hexulose-6-phosphate synthase/ribonuclease regulator [Thermoplasmata archaeon]
MWPALQIALDLHQIGRTVVIAKEAVEGGADWIEVGTPLIKSEGAEAIRVLRKEFPGMKIVADTKTMDVGGYEVELMAKAGADVVTILGLADDGTLSEGVMVARKYGAEIMLDLINVPDKVKRAKEAEKIGVSYICLHMGIDEQMKGEEPPIEILKKIVAETNLPVAVAGGITADNAGEYVEAGASIVIVGGGIIKTQNIVESARSVKNAMTGKEVTIALAKKYSEDELFEAFSMVSTPNISDAYHKQGVVFGLTPHIKSG